MPTDASSAFPLPYALLLAVVAAQRLGELRLSRRHLQRSGGGKAAGGTGAWASMIAVHVLLIVLPAAEVGWRGHGAPPLLFWSALTLFGVAELLRYAALHALGSAWNARAVVASDLRVVRHGPYRFVRHPNYLAVLLEFTAIPLAGGAWFSWLLLNLLHAPILAARMRAEDELLLSVPGYREAMANKGALLPGLCPLATPSVKNASESLE